MMVPCNQLMHNDSIKYSCKKPAFNHVIMQLNIPLLIIIIIIIILLLLLLRIFLFTSC